MGEDDGRPDMVNRDPNGLNESLVVSIFIEKLIFFYIIFFKLMSLLNFL